MTYNGAFFHKRHLTYLVSILICIVFSSISASFYFPQPTGPYPIGTRALYCKDTTRKESYSSNPSTMRELMIQCWYPAQGTKSTEPKTSYPLRAIAEHKEYVHSAYKIPTFLLGSLDSIYTYAQQEASIKGGQELFPVIIFSPGVRALSTDNTALCENLASHGYVVMSIGHTYISGSVIFPDKREIKSVVTDDDLKKGDPDFWDNLIKLCSQDVKSVIAYAIDLNNSKESIFYKRLNVDRMGICGHSLGGSVAMQASRIDSHIKAIVNMDGGLFAKDTPLGLDKPFLFMTFKRSSAAPSWVEKNKTDITRFFESMRSAAYELTIQNASHRSFTDWPLIFQSSWALRLYNIIWGQQTIDAYKVSSIINDYTVSFFDRYLYNKPSINTDLLIKKYPEAQCKEWQ